MPALNPLNDNGFLALLAEFPASFSNDNPIGLSSVELGLGDFFAALPYFLP
jgi:hypothetical protein